MTFLGAMEPTVPGQVEPWVLSWPRVVSTLDADGLAALQAPPLRLDLAKVSGPEQRPDLAKVSDSEQRPDQAGSAVGSIAFRKLREAVRHPRI